MDSIRIPFKQDDFGNDIFARVVWAKTESQKPKPLVLIYHGGGLMLGNSEIVPKPQVDWLADNGFIVVIPNYRLLPQVSGATSLSDSVEAHDWATSGLKGILKSEHDVEIDTTNVVTMGHSSGGTIALHLASCRPVKAVTAFYPSLYFSDTTTSSHKPYDAPPYDKIPDYFPTEDEWNLIAPAGAQISECSLPGPNVPPPPRSKWQVHVSTKGFWMNTMCPDGDFSSVDPLTRLSANYPPTMFVQGETDTIPGSHLEFVKRAEKDMQAAGVKEVIVEVVPGVGHMFDLLKPLGSQDFGSEWQAIVKGLEFLKSHIKQ